MEMNLIVISVVIVAILAFMYFVITRNNRDRKELEKELNQKELKPDKHTVDKV